MVQRGVDCEVKGVFGAVVIEKDGPDEVFAEAATGAGDCHVERTWAALPEK